MLTTRWRSCSRRLVGGGELGGSSITNTSRCCGWTIIAKGASPLSSMYKGRCNRSIILYSNLGGGASGSPTTIGSRRHGVGLRSTYVPIGASGA